RSLVLTAPAASRGFLLRGLFNVCPLMPVHHPRVITSRADIEQTLTIAAGDVVVDRMAGLLT
ncbi:MAG: hypothetical protein NDI67_01495, partial [Sulfuritalea sp.]|nr:hypothetical protein [Sulfuritalea sp.]